MIAYITGSGTAVPEKVITNEELGNLLGIDPDQIFKSSGIRRRRWISPGTTTSSLASEALDAAITDAQLQHDDIDYLIFGTMTPDRFIPGSAPSVQHRLGLRQIPCLDIRQACCNALYALQIAKALVNSDVANRVAICLAEVQSLWLDLSAISATTSMLFGDGASAIIVSGEKQSGDLELIDLLLATDGTYVDDLGIRSPGTEYGFASKNKPSSADNFQPRMVGQSVILNASRKMTSACQDLVKRNALDINDIRWIVPHQANSNLLAQVARGLRLSPECEVISLLEDFGNTSSASLGMALDQLRRSNRIKSNEYMLLPAFGAGFTWGAGLVRAK